jgi:hypothetical protein
MRYKSQYTKRKKINGLFLEAVIEPNWADDYGKIVPIENIEYKIVCHSGQYGKAKIGLNVYDTDNFDFWISSKGCRFYRRSRYEFGEGIYSENIREFWRYLRNFEYDLQQRLNDAYIQYKDEMSEECKGIIKEVLDKL